MRALLAVVLASTVLAGCAGEEPAAAPAAVNDTEAVFVEDYAFSDNVTIPREELENATLGPEHVHDPWGEALEMTLLDETIVAGLCEGPVDAAIYLMVRAFAGEPGAYGCARVSLPEGVVVPEGTGALRVEADATDALKSGAYAFQWRSKAHEAEGETSTDPVHTWRVELDESDWDIPHANATTFTMYLASRGPAGVFEGNVAVRVVAERAPGWEPVLAVAHVDHWKLPHAHDFPAPGVMRLLDAEASVTNVDPLRFVGQNAPQPVPLADIVAPGARWITVVADHTGSDCAPVLDCWLVPVLQVGGYERQRVGEEILHEGARRVYAWSVPEEVPPDSVYADVSTTQVDPRINACAAGDANGSTCGFASVASGTASARLLVLAWQGEVDLDVLRAIAG
ncbi:MAG TPA: hypothetical protein VHH36_05460 [Candidatus Thermoplasmatota archaeon]|nr:hypothetical protein [Candidatus Thermoplasmatota archaeon]